MASDDASTTTLTSATLARWCRGFLDLLAPPRCAGCEQGREHWDPLVAVASEPSGHVASILCPRCRSELTPMPEDRCPLCQESAARAHHDGNEGHGICDRCRSSRSPLASCVAGFAYEGAAETWIHRFKYPGSGIRSLQPQAEQVTRSLIRDAAAKCPERIPRLIIPIPLHPRRLRERGFNPACVLARALSRSSGARLSTRSLVRIRDTPSQTQLGRRERGSNVRGAFRSWPTTLEGPIWLVDDVVTTGATLREAARALRCVGASEIHAICCARSLTTKNEPAPGDGGMEKHPWLANLGGRPVQ